MCSNGDFYDKSSTLHVCLIGDETEYRLDYMLTCEHCGTEQTRGHHHEYCVSVHLKISDEFQTKHYDSNNTIPQEDDKVKNCLDLREGFLYNSYGWTF